MCTYGIHEDDEELALGLLATPWHKKHSLRFRAVLSISQLHYVSTLFAKFCRKHISPSSWICVITGAFDRCSAVEWRNTPDKMRYVCVISL